VIVALFLEKSLKNYEESRKLKRFGKKLFRALFDRPDCKINRSVGGQDQKWNSRIDLSKSREKIERSSIREHVIRNNDVRTACAKQVLRILAALSFIDFVAVLLEEITDTESHS
jgi:hypothetical protein